MIISGNDYAAHIEDRDQAEVQARQDFAEQEFIDNREEALALAEAFAELAKDIEGSEKIAAQVRAISGQEEEV